MDRSFPVVPSYPHPSKVLSKEWVSLNGEWQFESDEYNGPIQVPFGWSTPASGVNLPWLEQGTYLRTVPVPPHWNEVIVLRFDRVFYRASVRVNGIEIGQHEGGYTPFSFIIPSEVLRNDSFDLEVIVSSPRDKRMVPHGKQRSFPMTDFDGVCFSPTCGIWGDVWLEKRARSHIWDVSLLCTDIKSATISGKIMEFRMGDRIVISIEEQLDVDVVTYECDDNGNFDITLEVPEAKPWLPWKPVLYTLRLDLVRNGNIVSEAYVRTGFRKIEYDSQGISINAEPVFLKGVLDQNYWDSTGLTAPNEMALLNDLELAADMGFNFVRKHLLIPDSRWLSKADEMGILVWEEPPGPSRFSNSSYKHFVETVKQMIQMDCHHPSIVVWGLYNEEWGLDWNIPGDQIRRRAATKVYQVAKALDSTRPVVENSGWNHCATDILDWHYYEDSFESWKLNVEQLCSGKRSSFPVRLADDYTVEKLLAIDPSIMKRRIPFLNSEYGGGYTSIERAWHFKWQTQEMRRNRRICGYVYTEFSDVEHEMAGLLFASRQPKDLGGVVPSYVNSDIALIINVCPQSPGVDIDINRLPSSVTVLVDNRSRQSIDGIFVFTLTPAGRTFDFFRRNREKWLEYDSISIDAGGRVEISIPMPENLERDERLHYAFVAGKDQILAWSYLDIGVLEPLNRPDFSKQHIGKARGATRNDL